MSEAFPSLTGHEDAIRQVTEAFQSERMHHAWLLAGPEGIGKAMLAHRMAAYVLSGGEFAFDKVDPHNRAAKLVVSEAHPDMLVIRRATDEKTGELHKGIVVEDVLRIAAFLHTTSAHGGWRVVIVNDAHLLNRFGQNAILKILEEPSDRTLIIMTTTTAGALLPTIRSRCRMLPLAELDNKHMRAILARMAPELGPDDVKRLIELSAGSIGFALKLMRAEVLPLYDELEDLLGTMPGLDITRLHKLADQIARRADSESYEVLTVLLINRLYRGVRAMALSDSKTPRLDRKLLLWDKVRAVFAAAESSNLDRRLAFINAVVDIRNAA